MIIPEFFLVTGTASNPLIVKIENFNFLNVNEYDQSGLSYQSQRFRLKAGERSFERWIRVRFRSDLGEDETETVTTASLTVTEPSEKEAVLYGKVVAESVKDFSLFTTPTSNSTISSTYASLTNTQKNIVTTTISDFTNPVWADKYMVLQLAVNENAQVRPDTKNLGEYELSLDYS